MTCEKSAARARAAASVTTARNATARRRGGCGRAKSRNILDRLAQTVDTLDHRRDDLTFAHPWRQTRLESVQRSPEASQRIAHFVRHDGRELAELRQGLLFPQPRLVHLALGDVARIAMYCLGLPPSSRYGTMVVSTQ